MKNTDEKKDLRVRRTYKLLSDALMTLMKEKPFEKISVMDICNTAMVHRATFYSHFEDKHQLLHYCMRELEDAFNQEHMHDKTAESYREYYVTLARDLFNTVSQNKDMYSVVFQKDKSESMITNFQNFIASKVAENIKTNSPDNTKLKIPAEVLANFYVAGCVSIADWWISNNDHISLDEIMSYVNLLIAKIIE